MDINKPLIQLQYNTYYKIWLSGLMPLDRDCHCTIKQLVYLVCMRRTFTYPTPNDIIKYQFLHDNKWTYVNKQGIVFKLRGCATQKPNKLYGFELFAKQVCSGQNITKNNIGSLTAHYYPFCIYAVDLDLSDIHSLNINSYNTSTSHHLLNNYTVTVI